MIDSGKSSIMNGTNNIKETTLSDSRYARSTRALNDVVNALRDCGTEQVLSLPKIAVVGNQSAGKSSLIEAISQIKVPRSSGTCTRCPMEVVLRRGEADSWACNVYLRFGEDASDEDNVTSLFSSTKEKEGVEIILRRAQLAILNPSEKYDTFATMSEEDCKNYRSELKFSKNIVVVEIFGADVDVTFIDLPGIVSYMEKVSLTIDCADMI
jgi:vacuolar protein sorting-associated protein 1